MVPDGPVLTDRDDQFEWDSGRANDVEQTFGRYRIVEAIGRGGMAEVYRAKRQGAEGVEKEIVIKRILPEYAEDERFVDMFVSEAELAVELHHPNIVQIYDFGETDGDYFLAMEYVEGPNLSELLAACERVNRSMPTGDAVYVAGEIAEALHYAHEKTDQAGRPLHIVHRDVTPDNVLVSRDGTVKMADFGIAQARHVADEGDVVKGKYQYMSPEQVRGENVDRQSDVFSLGTVLFEMLCGRPLFERPSREETISLVETAVVPDLDRADPDIPEQLQRVLYRALEREPDDRYPDARTMQIELMEYLYDLGELHDAGTLARHLDAVESRLGETSTASEVSTAGTIERETATLQSRSTPETETAETVFRDTERETFEPEWRETKHAILIAGRIDGLLTLESILDEERLWRQVVDEYTRIVDSVADKRNGQIHHVDESGFLIAFGIPSTRYDDATRAVRVARDLREAVAGMNVSLEAPVRLSIGIALGDVLVERMQSEEGVQYQWSFCDARQRRADALAETAMTTEILLGPRLVDRIRHRYACEPVDASIDGADDEACEAHRLVGPRPASDGPFALERSRHSLHDRTESLEALRSRLGEVLETSRTLGCAIVGERGSGKSTVLETFRSELDDVPCQIVDTSLEPSDREAPMGALADLYLDMMGLEAPDDPRRLRDELDSRLDTLVSERDSNDRDVLLHALGSLFHAEFHADAFAPLDPDERRRRIFRSLRRVLSCTAERQPVVILLDDVHHLDPASWHFLVAYLETAPSDAVLVATTATRRALEPRLEHWRAFCRSDQTDVLELEELSPPDARHLIEERLRGHDLGSDPLVDDVHRWTGGNPLLIETLVDALQSQRGPSHAHGIRELEQIGRSPDWLPASIEAVMMERLDQLSPSLKHAIQYLAQIWSPFSIEEAATVLDAPRSEVTAQLEDLLDRSLLAYVPEGARAASPPKGPSRADGRRIYRIRRGLMRVVAARTLPEDEARPLHDHIASYVADRLDDPTASDRALLARHTERAGRPEEAAPHYADAAETALDVLGARESLRLAERALQLSDTPAERYRARRARSLALVRLGRLEEAEDSLTRRLETAQRLADPSPETETRLRRALLELRRGAIDTSRRLLDETSPPDASEAIDDTIVRSSSRALERYGRALVSLREGEHRRARKLSRRVLERHDPLESSAIEPGRHLDLEGVSNARIGDYEAAATCFEEGLERNDRPGAGDVERRLRCHLGRLRARLGDLGDAIEAFERVLDEARRLGDRRGSARSHVGLGRSRRMVGHRHRAVSAIRQGLYRARQTELERLVAKGLLQLGLCYLEAERFQAAARSLHQGLRIADSIPDALLGMRAMFALAHAQLRDEEGEPRTALVQAEDGLERADDAGLHWGSAYGRALAARAAAALDRPDDATTRAERAADVLEAPETSWIVLRVHYHRALALDGLDDTASDAALEQARLALAARTRRIDSPELRANYLERPIPTRLLGATDLDRNELVETN